MKHLSVVLATRIAVPCPGPEVGEPLRRSAAGVTAAGAEIATDGEAAGYPAVAMTSRSARVAWRQGAVVGARLGLDRAPAQ